MNDLHLQHHQPPYANNRHRAFWTLAILALTQIGSYGYLVNASVGHVVDRMNYLKKSSALSTEVAKLETAYYTLQTKISLETADNLNYIRALQAAYVNESGAPIVLLTRNN